MGTSSQLRTHSHGQDLESIKKRAVEVVEFVRSQGLEVRFSTEDTFRSSLNDLLDIYTAVDRAGADRIGIADTVGCATPRQTYHTVELLRRRLRCGIEAHFHNDTGGAISNAFCALEAGATHIDTCVLGIGERNGITPLGGLIARMITVCRESVVPRYRVSNLLRLEQLVADIANISIPFNNYVTGPSVFHHKAGIHAKAVLRDATTYEILRPEDFGLKRHVDFASRLTGWNSIKYRAQQLGMHVPDEVYRLCATDVKSAADTKRLSNEEADSIIRHRCSSWLDNKALRVN